MRVPDYKVDGWCLEDGEQRHLEAPKTFLIPDLDLRSALQPGDLAKLMFRICVEGEGEHGFVERMWVIVRERLGDIYLGILDNNPNSIAENETLWRGTELPFEPRHIIDALKGNAATLDLARGPVLRPWA